MRRRGLKGDTKIFFQKVVSGLLIFSLLFSISFQIPINYLFPSASAAGADFYNVVALVVQEDIYPGVRASVTQYAKNIQKSLEKTKAVVLPVPKTAQAIDIASLLESLYFEGYKGIANADFESKLVGEVFIGDIPLPVATEGTTFSKTILPYVDFQDKAYVYNHDTNIYERNSTVSTTQAEVWHSFISPNTGDSVQDIQKINAFFKKDNDFYTGKGNFQTSKGIVNGNLDESSPDSYAPFVFYYDQFRENAAADTGKYRGYQAYLDNVEDISYYRFSKQLAEKVKQYMLGEQSDELAELVKKIAPDFDVSKFVSPDTTNAGDISTRYITQNSTKKFIDIFNESTIGEFRKYVNNGGRYSGTAGDVNVDLPAFIVTVLDLVSAQVIKNANTELEDYIDDIVKNGLSRNIGLPTSFNNAGASYDGGGGPIYGAGCSSSYINFLHGKDANTITNASECSIFRGSLTNSGTLVEANRAFNIALTQPDYLLCGPDAGRRDDPNKIGQILSQGYWGGNSPINLTTDEISKGNFELGPRDLTKSITPLYDPAGGKAISDEVNTPSPLLCLNNNFILASRHELIHHGGGDGGYDSCDLVYQIPNVGPRIGWSCKTTNQTGGFNQKFEDFYKTFSSAGTPQCTTKQLKLGSSVLKSFSNIEPYNSEAGTGCQGSQTITYNFKPISSYVMHKSPVSEDLKLQIKSTITPSLPIDKDRYVDFIGANGSYQKINYPYLFRVKSSKKEPNMGDFDFALKDVLDKNSDEILKVIKNSSPNSLSGDNLALYQLLKTGDFPAESMDLYGHIKNKALKVYTLEGETKQISYLDTLLFALQWNSLNSPSAKYKFIFENYLSDEFGGNEFNFHLPKNKKAYEISYLGASGDAANMYIKMDPEGKDVNPYADILAQNSLLNGYLFGINTSSDPVDKSKDVFKCAPPDGVPIWQWIPAVICRLKDMLPPKIKISPGACGSDLLTPQQIEEIEACSGDVNKNGINDCIESKLTAGSIQLKSDASSYYYETPGVLEASLVDSEGGVMYFDNITDVYFRLIKIEVPNDKNKVFDNTNVKEIYNYTTETEESKKLVSQYINFYSTQVRADDGKAELVFSTKSHDANFYFESFVNIKDNKGTPVITHTSTPLKIEVRGDRLFGTAYGIDNTAEEAQLNIGEDAITAGEYTNIYLVDESKQDINTMYTQINNDSLAKQKLAISMSNYSKDGSTLPLEYPIQVRLVQNEKVIEQKTLESTQLQNFAPLFGLFSSGDYTLQVVDNKGNSFARDFQILADVAVKGKIQLGSNTVEKSGAISTHLFTLYDKFDNPANGDVYSVTGNISGSTLQFLENTDTKLEFQTIEGFRAFRTVSTETSGDAQINFEVKNISGETLFSTQDTLHVIDGFTYSITPVQSQVKVGGATYDFQVIVKNSSGVALSDMQSRIYVSLDSTLGTPTQAYFDVIDGKAIVSLTTKNVAKKGVILDMQLEGAKTIAHHSIDILPEKPIRIELALSKTQLEADPSATSVLKAELKDRYGNTVFTDSTSTLTLEIPEKYSHVVTGDKQNAVVKDGTSTFVISATQTPGIAYAKVSVTPSLDANTFTIPGQSPFPKTDLTLAGMKGVDGLTTLGKKFFEEVSSTLYRFNFYTEEALVTSQQYNALPEVLKGPMLTFFRSKEGIIVTPVSQNSTKVETFYFWNKQKIEGKKYNGIYTTLLGANYGDITQKDYLGGALIFDGENRSLAVTSLLNNPNKYVDVVSIQENGVVSQSIGADLVQNLEFSTHTDADGRLKLGINNTSLNMYVGDIYYNFANTTYLDVCKDVVDTMSGCVFSQDKSTILLAATDTGYSASYADGKLSLNSEASGEVFSIDRTGIVQKNANIYLEYDTTSITQAEFKIMSGERVIGRLGINIVDAKVIKTKDAGVLASSLAAIKNSVVVHVHGSQYGYRDISNGQNNIHYIYYQDPFASSFTLDRFTQDSSSGYENFESQGGLGWQAGNKTLLLFSSGKSVGESSMAYQSFGLINLGDPLVSMKLIQKSIPGKSSLRSFEQGVGDLLINDKNILAIKTFDYNDDNRKDILTLSSDGYFSLLENKKADTPYKNLGHLAYISDMKGRSVIETGDFSGDGHDDIFFVNKDGDPYLLNNVTKDFTRYPLKEQFQLEGKIMQVRSFDMDADGRDDLVTLDDAGQIHIFYGGGTSTAPTFTKKLIGNGYGIELSATPRSEGGAVYYDGLYQLPDSTDNSELLAFNEEYLKKIQENLDNLDEEEEFLYNASFVDNIIFEQIPYETLTQREELDFGNSSDPDVQASLSGAQDAINDFLVDYGDYTELPAYYSSTKYTTFMRSEFVASQGVKIEKVYTDVNGGTLKTGDAVKVDISITNEQTKNLKDFAYLESIVSPFTLNTEIPVQVSNGVSFDSPGPANYSMVFEAPSFAAGQSITIHYELTTLPIKFGHIQVGLFEKGEVGDDIWGDVIVKPNNKNCGDAVDIYRSTAARQYEKGKTKAQCTSSGEDDKTKDENGNGLPDYIEDLMGGNQDDLKDFANTELNNLYEDSDSDGIPNIEDDTPYYDSDSAGTSFEDAIAQKIDELSAQLDFLIKGFSCGFGGGSCIATPLNWAPLAPGSAPTLMGFPLGPLTPNTGYPVFSALTGLQMTCGFSPCCIPVVYPVSPLAYIPGPVCGAPSAGGYLGTWAPTNYLRIFVTPTLTGAVGTAICFGGPAIAAGFANPPGLHPIVPGGNCIVAAMPLFGCKDDGSDGHITDLVPPTTGDFAVINGNCSDGSTPPPLKPEDGKLFDTQLVQEYMAYKKTGVYPAGFKERLKKALTTVASGKRYPGGVIFPRDGLIQMQGGGADDMSLSVDIDTKALASGNFQDVIKIQMKRVWPFPDFLMEWVTRQIEEIVTKLTDLPTLFIILPDFSGIMDDRWGNFSQNFKNALDKSKQDNQKKEDQRKARLQALREQKAGLDCSGKDSARCLSIDAQASKLIAPSFIPFGARQSLGGLGEVYQFLSNLPLISIEPQTVSINIPWIDQASINKALLSWQTSLDQWRREIDRAIGSWSYGAACTQPVADEKAACEAENALKEKLIIDARKLVSSLEKNIQTLNEYKDFPKKLADLLGKKDERIEQILCNIETISSLVGGWIGKNGKRFQAWVELIILIKAILKSWQVLIDIFDQFDQSCHKCKNERHDLMYFVFKLINMIIPKIPIIQFPKWPDIILDVHNIRAGMTVFLPDFKLSLRPITLPNLPALTLPDAPSVTLKIPSIPLLPSIKLPTLPDLPSLPKVELPDLPPPPKIPKIFASLEALANIAKLVTKVMCILKSSPFVPEWRAGDQIAFITERSGYLSFDFLDLALPQFSYPFVDAIKVTTYVNLEFENEFVVEMVKNILKPLNNFSANITNSMNWNVQNLDFSEMTPGNIIIDPTKKDPIKTGQVTPSLKEILAQNQSDISKAGENFVNNLAVMAKDQITQLVTYVDAHKDVQVESKEFVQEISANLASHTLSVDPTFSPLHQIWKEALGYDYAKEKALIEELQKSNQEKYTLLHDILTTEKEKNAELKKQVQDIYSLGVIQNVVSDDEAKGRIDAYNKKLQPYNQKALDALENIVSPDFSFEEQMQVGGEQILERVKSATNTFTQEGEASFVDTQASHNSQTVANVSQALALNSTQKTQTQVLDALPLGGISSLTSSLSPQTNTLLAADTGGAGGACTSDGKKFTYKGLYVVEDGVSYRLTHYLDEFTGDEEPIELDFDTDSDTDLLYMMGGQVFLKENLKNKDTSKVYVTDAPLFLGSANNKFFNGDTYYEAVNGLKEGDVNDSFINVIFQAPKRDDVNNFRLEFYQIVDKFTNLLSPDYIPENLKKYVIDAIAGVEDVGVKDVNDMYTLKRNIAQIQDVSDLGGVRMLTKEVVNIKANVEAGLDVNVTGGNELYAGGEDFKLGYRQTDDEDVKYVYVEKYHNITFDSTVKVVSLEGDAYVITDRNIVIEGQSIQDRLYLPLPLGTKIFISDEAHEFSERSHMRLRYYDNSQFDIDFRKVKSYLFYDLGRKSTDTYLIRQELKNDFYYAVIRPFQDNILGILSHQILLSPQKEADERGPEISLDQPIRVPVYQKQLFDFTSYIYEETGISSVTDFYIDFDLDTDSDDDGNKTNDRTIDKIQIFKTPSYIKAEFGKYDSIFKKKIGLNAIDANGNKGYKEVDFEVYPPIPTIKDAADRTISGHIDENLLDEPVNVYRYRGGILSKLLDESGKQKVPTGSGGTYALTSKTASGVTLKYQDNDVAFIDEFTGHIRFISPALTADVLPSNSPLNDKVFPEIILKMNGGEIYYQYLTFSKAKQAQVVSDFEGIKDAGMYLKFGEFVDGYSTYYIPLNAPINPGAMIVYDVEKGRDKPLFTLFQDGRINAASGYKLMYGSYGNIVMFRLYDVAKDREIGKVLMKVDGNFIIQ